MTLRRSTTKAALWQGSARATDRVLRFGSSMVLARLLDQEDFGVLAATLTVVAALEAISYVGVDQAIIQSDRGEDPRLVGTAFRTMAIRGVILTALALLLAPVSAWYFEDAAITPLVAIVAWTPLATGLGNPWLHSERRGLRFREFSISIVAGSVVQVGTAIGLAMAGFGAAALAWAYLVAAVGTTVAGWALLPRRVDLGRDALARAELRASAARTAGVPFLIMLSQQAPSMILGRLAGLPTLGIYTLALRLCSLPTEIALPIFGSVLTPAYATIRDDPARLARVWLRTFGAIAQVVMPVVAAMVVLDEEVPLFVYGSKYEPAAGLVSMLAVNALVQSLTACCGPLFWGIGRPEIDRTSLAIRLVAIGAFAVAGAAYGGATAFAAGVNIGLLGGFFYCLAMIRRILSLRRIEIARALVPGAVLGGATLALGALARAGVARFAGDLGGATQGVTVVLVGLIALAAIAVATRGIRESQS